MATPQTTPPKGKNTTMLIAAAVVLVAVIVGAYFLFFSGGTKVAEGPVIPEGAMVGNGDVGDIEAFLKKSLGEDAMQKATYTVDGNTLKDVTITGPDGETVTIKEVKFLALDTQNEQPKFMDVRLTGISAQVPEGKIPGVTKLDGDVVYAYAWDEASGSLSVPAVSLSFPGITSISLSGDFTDIQSLGGGAPEQAMSALAGAKIKNMTIVWADEAIIRAALENLAKEQGMTLDELSAGAQFMLSQIEDQMKGDLEKQVLDVADTVLSEIDPVTITLKAEPTEPFPFAKFMALGMGAGGIPDLSALEPLNLTIAAD